MADKPKHYRVSLKFEDVFDGTDHGVEMDCGGFTEFDDFYEAETYFIQLCDYIDFFHNKEG